MHCLCLRVLGLAHMKRGLSLIAHAGGISASCFWGGGMRRLLQFRLGCHGLPISTDHLAGVVRAHTVCSNVS